MTKIIRHILMGIIATAALFSGTVTAATLSSAQFALRSTTAPGEEMVTRLMVKPHATAGIKLARSLQAFDARRLVKAANVSMQVLRPMSGGAHVIKLDNPVTLSEARVIAARLMRNDPGVELAEPDRIKHPTATTPGDPDYASQWHYFAPAGANLGGANLPNAWGVTKGTSIIVAVIDTGVLLLHDDLIGQTMPGYDFITDLTSSNDGDGRNADPTDPGDWVAANECGPGSPASDSSWHGTHVSGTIAAAWNNMGGAGIAPDAKILPVRVLGKCGGYDSDIIDGMRWAAGIAVPGVPLNQNPAQVLNMSLAGTSGDPCTSIYQTAINEIVGKGEVIVVAAGNDGLSNVSPPANCLGVIAVTAHAIDGDNAWYANIGPEITLSAPGGGCGGSVSNCRDFTSANGPGIYSTMDTGKTVHSTYSWSAHGWAGTSMAAPHVAGTVALMLSVNQLLTPAQVTSYLQSSARPHPAHTVCTSTDPNGVNTNAGLCGAGLLDAAAALAAISAGWPTVTITSPSQLVAAGATVTLLGSATAAPGRTISSYSWTQLSGASVGTITNATLPAASFTAPATGTYSFKLTATDDNSNSGSATAIVTVDSAPVLTSVPLTKTVTVGGTLNFVVTAYDVDGGILVFDATSLPPRATLSTDGIFNWSNAAPAGNYTLTYFATDPLGASSDPATVTINVVAAPASSGGGGGGGCSLDPGKPDPALPVIMVIAGLYLMRRRLVRKAQAGKN
jgi:serine protease